MLTAQHKTALVVWLVLQVVLMALAIAAVTLPDFRRLIFGALVALLVLELVLYAVWRRKTGGIPPSE